MADVVITVNKPSAMNAVTAVVASPATEAVADTAQIFYITPTKPGEMMTILCSNANGHGSVALVVAKGAFVNSVADLALTIPQNTTNTFQLDSTKYTQADGKIKITATPAEGKILLTNHAFTMTVVESLLG